MSATGKQEQGKKLALGQVFTSYTLDVVNVEVPIKRMPMESELLFLDVYKHFVEFMREAKTEVMASFKSLLPTTEEPDKQIDLIDGLAKLGELLDKMPAFQVLICEAIQVILDSRQIKLELPLSKILSTVDAIEILSSQAEVQGLLGIFRDLTGPGPATASN